MTTSLPPALFAGGGSAGHVSPMLAIADAMRRRDPDVPLLMLGTEAGLEARLVPERGYDLATIEKVPAPRKLSADVLKFPGKLTGAVKDAGAAIDRVGAQVVVGMGGYVSTPAYIAAKRRGIPVVLHEQNAVPGMANKLGAQFAAAVLTTFPGTPLKNAMQVGLPLRQEIVTLDRVALRGAGRQEFGLDPHAPTLLVTGGSLGAQAINEAMVGAAELLAEAGVQVLHVTGKGKSDGIPAREGNFPYRVVEYVSRMDLAYAAADLVLCRSGANTVCELTAVGLPAVYVPLPIGNGEQRRNAEPVVAAGGGLLIDNADVADRRRNVLAEQVLPLVTNQVRLAEMARASAEFGVTDADERIVDAIAAAAGGA